MFCFGLSTPERFSGQVTEEERNQNMLTLERKWEFSTLLFLENDSNQMINYENSLLINYVAAVQGTSEQAHPVWIYFRCSRVIFLLSFCRSVIPNCQFRSKTSRLKTFTANQLDEIKDPSGLFYILPFQKVREFHLMKSRCCTIAGFYLEVPSHSVSGTFSTGLSGQLGRPEESVGPSVWKGNV